jgi:hypothetical protein
MKIKMLETRLGSPNGYEVRTYVKDASYEVPADLGNDLITGKYAEVIDDAKPAISASESENGDTVTWPPTDEALDAMSFENLGKLLTTQGVADITSLKSKEARRAAIRDLIAKQTEDAGATAKAAAAAQGDEPGK